MQLELIPRIDPEVLHRINNTAIEQVNELTLTKAAWLCEVAELAITAQLDGRDAGVIIVLNDHTMLESEYYGWFTARFRNFLYIDRVIVEEWARGQGVASALYRYVDTVATAAGLGIVTEVYCQPPNQVSLDFHAKMGFTEIATQWIARDGKRVSKLLKYGERLLKVTA